MSLAPCALRPIVAIIMLKTTFIDNFLTARTYVANMRLDFLQHKQL